jgi:hypothetical protein
LTFRTGNPCKICERREREPRQNSVTSSYRRAPVEIEKVVRATETSDVAGEGNTRTVTDHEHGSSIRTFESRGLSSFRTDHASGVNVDKDAADDDRKIPFRMPLTSGDPIDENAASVSCPRDFFLCS